MLLNFHFHDTASKGVMLPAFYMDGDYSKVAVRIYADTVPVRDAKFDIFDDGVSIFQNRTIKKYNISSGVDETGADSTSIYLPAGAKSDELADVFNSEVIQEGSWLTGEVVDAGSGKNFTVQLELSQVSEDDEED